MANEWRRSKCVLRISWGQLDGPVAGTDRFGQLDGALFDGTNDGMFVPHDEVFSHQSRPLRFGCGLNLQNLRILLGSAMVWGS